MKRIFIEGRPGSGQTYFYLPVLIKLIKPVKAQIYQIKVDQLENEKLIGPYWDGVSINEYQPEEITKNDLLFCDCAVFIKDENLQREIANHPHLVIVGGEQLKYINWLDPIKFLVVTSEYVKPQNFFQKLVHNKSRSKIKELETILNTNGISTNKPKTLRELIKESRETRTSGQNRTIDSFKIFILASVLCSFTILLLGDVYQSWFKISLVILLSLIPIFLASRFYYLYLKNYPQSKSQT